MLFLALKLFGANFCYPTIISQTNSYDYFVGACKVVVANACLVDARSERSTLKESYKISSDRFGKKNFHYYIEAIKQAKS